MQDLSQLPGNTPVIIGVAAVNQHNENPLECGEAWQLMAMAVEKAAHDAVGETIQPLLSAIDSIIVPQGMWAYKNPAALVAKQIGANSAKSAYATIGIPQLSLLSDACQAIVDGERQLAVVTGGEAKYRSLMAQIQGIALEDVNDEGAVPDFQLVSEDALWSEVEGQRGLLMPTEFYAIMESSMRYADGEGIEQHRNTISQLYNDFSKVAVNNPDAWYQQEFSVEEIRDPIGKNAMLAFPYTKKHNTQWNVNQASAIIVASLDKARQLGVDQSNMVFPLAVTQSCHAIAVSERPVLHRHKGTELAAKRLYELTATSPGEIDFVELYSCFPVAVRSFALDASLGLDRQLTVTGGMPFSGGPLNNFTLQGLARLTQLLRGKPGSKGLISNISGMITKQSFALLSTEPPANGWQFDDVSEQTASQWPAVATDLAYQGEVTVLGYTVVYNKEQQSHAVAVCSTPEGKRTVGQCREPGLMAAMVSEEFCGKTMLISADGQLSLPG